MPYVYYRTITNVNKVTIFIEIHMAYVFILDPRKYRFLSIGYRGFDLKRNLNFNIGLRLRIVAPSYGLAAS